jgi:hypothetical protein
VKSNPEEPTVGVSCGVCNVTCNKCLGPESSDCDPASCNDGYAWNTNRQPNLCQIPCPAGAYYDTVEKQCLPCLRNCVACETGLDCTTCKMFHKNFYTAKGGVFIHKCLNVFEGNNNMIDAGVPDRVNGEFHLRCDTLLDNCTRCRYYKEDGLLRCLECSKDSIADFFDKKRKDIWVFTKESGVPDTKIWMYDTETTSDLQVKPTEVAVKKISCKCRISEYYDPQTKLCQRCYNPHLAIFSLYWCRSCTNRKICTSCYSGGKLLEKFSTQKAGGPLALPGPG